MYGPEQPPPPPWLERWIQLSRQLRQFLGEQYQAAGLNETRSAILTTLAATSRPCTQTDLAALLSLSESNLCTLIERMRSEGLLIRERSTLDRRKTLLSLTSDGALQSARVSRIHEECERLLAERLPSADAAELSRLLTVLTASLGIDFRGNSNLRRAS